MIIIKIFLKILKYLLYLFFLPFWWLQILIPRNKKVWVFGAWDGFKYSDNSKKLYEYVVSNNTTIHCVWLTKSVEIKSKLINTGKNCELIYSFKGIYYSLRAGFVIYSSGRNDVNPFFINGACVINTWHGAPMKRIGQDDIFGYSQWKDKLLKLLFPFIREYELDAVVSTSDVFTQIMSSAFNLPIENVYCSGYPRNDILFSTLIHPLNQEWDLKFDKPLKILYLPTFRDHTSSFSPFKEFEFNEALMNDFLIKTNSIFISKGHFVDKAIGIKTDSSRIIHLIDDNVEDINFILKDIDILITDYSGVYFDFLLTNKPIIFAPFDIDIYISECRQLYFNYNDVVCGPIATNWNEIINAIQEIIDNDNYVEKRLEMKCKFNKHFDSNNSKRLYTQILFNMNKK